MTVTIDFSVQILRYPCSFQALMEHKVKQAIRWDDTIKVTDSFIDLYKCASCKPVYRIPFIDYPQISKIKAMKNGEVEFADVQLNFFIPNSIF